MDKKIVLMFIFLLIMGAVGVNKIIQDSNVNTTQDNQQNTPIGHQNTGINQQNNLSTSSNSYSTDSSNISTSNNNQVANINIPDSTSSSSNSRQYE